MNVKKKRWLAGVLAAVCVVGFTGIASGAAVPGAPWFDLPGLSVPQALTAPLRMAAQYESFWLYADGMAWVQFQEMRAAGVALPASYLARSGAPLPGMPAPEAEAPVVEEPPVVVEEAGALPDEPAAYEPGAGAEEGAKHPIATPGPKPAPGPGPGAGEGEQVEPDPTEPDKAQPTPAEPKPGEPKPTEPKPTEPKPTEPKPTEPKPTEPKPIPAQPGLTAAEQQMLGLINAERAKTGLAPLTADPRLVATARAKSQDMIDGNYFDHNSPTLGSPFDQIRSAGITYQTAGENIAYNQSVQAAHTALMNSSGHRANILSARFTKIGIGIVDGGRFGMMVTQQFIGE